MTVGDDHFLEGVRRQVLTGGSVMAVRRLLVIHFTAGMSAQSSIDWWKKPAARGASAHIVIDRDGTIIQCRAFNRTAGHAGVSGWRDPKTGKAYTGINSIGIGIELANAGDSVTGTIDAPLAFGKYKCPALATYAKHKNGGGKKLWENYPLIQLGACFDVANTLVKRYRLDDVCGHEDIAPSRKSDPGPAFPMGRLREHCGFKGLPQVWRG